MSRLRGSHYEACALIYLRLRGLRLQARNVNYRGGELDLVMCDRRGTLVFVEVRARASGRYGGALASIDANKQRRLRLAAQLYLRRYGDAPPPCRFDVVAFQGGTLTWVRNAFELA